MKAKPRTFESFPKNVKCPICATNDDGECLLIPIDGTGDGSIALAAVTHLWCAVATNYSKSVGVMYVQSVVD